MTAYTLVIEDRHEDVEVRVYKYCDVAIRAARRVAKEHAHFPEDIEEYKVPGWEYYCRYSCEGDSVRVECKEIIEEEAP